MTGLRGKTLVAYLILCIVWGSTYLAIRIGVADLPVALFAGSRFLTAGLVLGAMAVALGQRLPQSRRDWTTLATSGLLLLVGGNGAVVWAEQYVPSGPASVYIAAVPIWTAVFDTIVPGGTTRFSGRLLGGLLLGFLGAGLLTGSTPAELLQSDLRGPLALLFASASWSIGSVYLNRRRVATTPYVTAAVQMTVAGALLTGTGLLTGQGTSWELTGRGIAALGYLIVFGSIIAYSAYAYALHHASPTVVGTYAYANPAVAVGLGWLFLDEVVTWRTLAAMALVLGAVLLIQTAPRNQAEPTGPAPEATPAKTSWSRRR